MRLTIGIAAAGLIAAGTGFGVAAAVTSSGHPASEHVPALKTVRLAYDENSLTPPPSNKVVIETGTKAARLVTLFNQLKPEPKDTVHCDIAGGPQTTVIFRGAKHRWVATEAACTNVVVTRDGKAQPTLLPSRAWTKTVNRDLGK